MTAALHGSAGPIAQPEDWMLITGYDLDSLAWTELGGTVAPARDVGTERRVDLSDVVPSADHDELAELLADACAAVSLRDDNGMIIAAWPMGLLRRAMLAAGGRLGLGDRTLAVELTVDELTTALRGERTVDGGRDRVHDAPIGRGARRCPLPTASDRSSPSRPLDALPAPLARIGAAQLAAADQTFGTGGPVGVGARSHVGRALVVDDPAEALDLVEDGDVVITAATSPAWNVVLAAAGAIVTAHGGLVSHAAVIARELDIPAVIGDRSALRRFRTGDIVLVDPVRARVVEGGSTAGAERVGVSGESTMAPFQSVPSLVVLHAVRITGRAPTATLPELTGLSVDAVRRELSAAAETGDVCARDGALAGWSLTPAGRRRHDELLTDERVAAGRSSEVLEGYDELIRLNGWFKRLCTEWQLGDHPASCIERLDAGTARSRRSSAGSPAR